MNRDRTINSARFAGRWYPGDPKRLAADLDRYLSEASAATGRPAAPLTGAVLPHAGLSYSGYGMADAFANLNRSDLTRVVILAPSHYVPIPADTLTVGDHAFHQTPFGEIAGDPGFLTPGGMVRLENPAVEQEHGTELFFPFIYHTLGSEVRLQPVLVGPISGAQAAGALADLIVRRLEELGELETTLFIVSSDFTHYGERFGYTPFGIAEGRGEIEAIEAKVEADDREVAMSAAACDGDALFRRYRSREITVCGRYPILLASRVFDYLGVCGELTRYYNSNRLARASGDFVCYASILFGEGRR